MANGNTNLVMWNGNFNHEYQQSDGLMLEQITGW